MEFEYQIEEDDFVNAQELSYKTRRPRSSYRRVLVAVSWAILLVSTLFLIWYQGTIRPMLPFLLLLLIVPARKLLIPWQARRQFRKMPMLQERRSVTAEDAGLHFLGATFESRMTWEPFVRFAENAKTFILVQQGGQLFFPIPKRELSALQIDELRSLFASHVAVK